MAVSVRMEPLLEKQLEQAAKRQGVTKSQFIIDAVQRALGRKNPYQLMLESKALIASEPLAPAWTDAFQAEGNHSYDTELSRQTLIAKLRAKHGLSSAN